MKIARVMSFSLIYTRHLWESIRRKVPSFLIVHKRRTLGKRDESCSRGKIVSSYYEKKKKKYPTLDSLRYRLSAWESIETNRLSTGPDDHACKSHLEARQSDRNSSQNESSTRHNTNSSTVEPNRSRHTSSFCFSTMMQLLCSIQRAVLHREPRCRFAFPCEM